MVKIYLIRHCESAGNKKKLFQGRNDADITEFGQKQLDCLKKRFENIPIDAAYSSPLIRAFKTAEAAADGHNIKVIPEPLFIEQFFGDWDGTPIADIETLYPDFFDVWDNRPQDLRPVNGESRTEVYERVWSGVLKFLDDPENEGKSIIVASHGAAIRTVICRLLFNDIEKLAYTPWSINTAVSLIVKDESGIRLEFMNDVSHLPESLRKSGRLLYQKEL